jgi:hypothetical protein
MAQRRFFDPVVSVAPNLVGTGNGTLSVDRLTHFTTAQTYTCTCISKSPDTIFSIVGSLDGAVGLAIVGQQFYDEDLKVFLTITQGSTPFEVGDVFTFSVINGTDLNQDNIDDYDEEPQKNFGTGTKGSMSGDDNIRFSETALPALLTLGDLRFTAVVPGAAGNNLQVQYLSPVAAIAASRTIQDLDYEAVTAGAAGNSISVLYEDWSPAVKALLALQDITYQAFTAGLAGNSITIEYVNGGSLSIGVIGNAITVTFVSGVTTATAIVAAITGDIAASALVQASVSGTGSNPQTAPVAATNLAGGDDAHGEAGDEEVTVLGNAITVKMQDGVSTATQIHTKLLASMAAMALVGVTISGTGSNPQTFMVAPLSLQNGADGYGTAGNEDAVLNGNVIEIYMEPGVSTATQIAAAVTANAPVAAVVSTSLVGAGSNPQAGPISATNLSGGKAKRYSFNRDELTDVGNFVEGNADVLAQSAALQGNLDVAGDTKLSGQVSLTDTDALSGPALGNIQRAINSALEDRAIAFRTADDSKVTWSNPDLFFDADIVIRMTATGIENTIPVAESPISIADGESLYVILDRETTRDVIPLVGSTVPRIPNALRIASRFGDNLILADNTLVRDGKSVRIGEGGEGGTVKVDLYDPVSTTLPSGPSATIDGVSLANDMMVLFSNLSSGNKRVYKAAGVGTSITWIAQSVWSNGLDPTLGDDLIVMRGAGFTQARGFYDGTSYLFNDRVRYYNGADYWEMSNLKQASLLNNTVGDVFAINYAGSENLFVDYTIIRNGKKAIGTVVLTTDGTEVAFASGGAEQIPLLGITFDADIDSGQIRLRYTTTNTGFNATMKFVLRRWADAAGGPGGIPSYSGTSGIAAAGVDTNIQFNDSGAIGADSDFTWSKSTNILSLAGLQVAGKASAVVADNVVSPTAIVSYDSTLFPSAMIEYSIFRDGKRRTGRIIVSVAGIDIGVDEEGVDAGASTGVTLSVDLNAGNVEISYTSTSLGVAGTFTWSVRRWA